MFSYFYFINSNDIVNLILLNCQVAFKFYYSGEKCIMLIFKIWFIHKIKKSSQTSLSKLVVVHFNASPRLSCILDKLNAEQCYAMYIMYIKNICKLRIYNA